MQYVQIFGVRFVMGMHRHDHITPCLKELKRLIPVAKKLYLRDAVLPFQSGNDIARILI